MRFILFILLFAFLFVVQMGVLPHFLVFGFSLNILLVSAFVFAFLMTIYRDLIIYAFISGFLLDVYSGVPFGIVLLSFVLSVITVNFLAYNFFGRENIFVVCIGAAVGSLAYFLIYFGIMKAYGLFKFSPELAVGALLFSKAAFFSIILNTAGTVILYAPLKKFMKFTDNFKR